MSYAMASRGTKSRRSVRASADGQKRRNQARYRYTGLVSGLLLVSSLANCSSGASSPSHVTEPKATAGTSPTSAPNPQAVAEFLAGASGKMLLTYEHATDRFVAGSRPDRADCERFLRDVFPTIARSTDDLLRVVGSVPDAPLRAALRQDISDRVLLLGACVSRSGLAVNDDMDRTYRLYRDQARATAQLLARFGVTP